MLTGKTITLAVVVQFSFALALAAARPVQEETETNIKKYVEPKLVERVEADYPDDAGAEGIGGSVFIEIVVDDSGVVTGARALTGHKRLRGAALKAAKEWKFKPATIDGRATKTLGAITFCFAVKRSKTTSRCTFAFQDCCPKKVKKTEDPCAVTEK
jgi:TonB family protein